MHFFSPAGLLTERGSPASKGGGEDTKISQCSNDPSIRRGPCGSSRRRVNTQHWGIGTWPRERQMVRRGGARERSQSVIMSRRARNGAEEQGGGKGGREVRVVVQGESAREREIERGRETERDRIGEREGGRKHHTRFLGERIRSVGPVSRFVSDWCRVRGSRESTVRAARCVPLRPGGHVTRSPAGGRTAHSASKSGRPAMCVVYRARDSRARVGRIARVLGEEEKERD